jgi:hypothetical protein
MANAAYKRRRKQLDLMNAQHEAAALVRERHVLRLELIDLQRRRPTVDTAMSLRLLTERLQHVHRDAEARLATARRLESEIASGRY